MSSFAEVVEVVIGVDTHKHSHTAAVVIAGTGAAVDERTVDTDPDGYAELVAMADEHLGLRAWAIEGTGGYGAGLARFLTERGEVVIELDRPNRPARRNGSKSDPLDAVRAAREALAREHHAQPRARGERAALSVLLAARRSAIDAATDAQRQLNALVIASPETLRSKFRGLSTRRMLPVAAKLRISPSWDIETATTARVLRDLARRSLALEAEAKDHDSTAAETANSTAPYTSSSSTGCVTIPQHVPTPNDDALKAGPTERSAAASSATSHASSTASSNNPLTRYRSVHRKPRQEIGRPTTTFLPRSSWIAENWSCRDHVPSEIHGRRGVEVGAANLGARCAS